MTNEEKQDIINAVIASLRTNGKTIMQLTPVSEIIEGDFVELSGGRRVELAALLSVYQTYEQVAEVLQGTLSKYLTATQVADRFARLSAYGLIVPNQSLIVPLASMGSAYDNVDGGTYEYTPAEGDFYYANGRIYEKTSNTPNIYPVNTKAVYVNLHTRRGYLWTGSKFMELGGDQTPHVVLDSMSCSDRFSIGIGRTAYMPSLNRIVTRTGQTTFKSSEPSEGTIYCDATSLQTLIWDATNETWVPVGGSGGGGAASGAVKRNVNTLQTKVDELIGLLANSAFSTSRPEPIGTLDWGDDTPVETYYNVGGISASHAMYSVSNAATKVLAGSSYNNVITAKAGYDLLGVTVNGVAQTVNNDSCTINISNVQGDITIVVSAQAESVTPTITHTVQATLTDLNLQPYGGTVNDGGTFTATLELASGVTGKRLPTLSEITINGSHGTASLTNGVLTIPNITSDISIIASAVATSGVTHSVTYNLSGVNKASGATEVEDGQTLTAVLSKGSDWQGVYGSSDASSKNYAFSKRDVLVMMNGNIVGTLTQASLNSDVTVSLQNVTGDVVVMNIQWLLGQVNNSGGISTGQRSVYNDTLIPLPDGCETLTIRHNNNNGLAFYDAGGNFLSNSYVALSGQTTSDIVVPSGAKFIRVSIYDAGGGEYSMNIAYILDVTHNKYIWKGDSVQ